MARYLTPASIGLLSLIELYTDEVVPIDSSVPILSFIVSHLLPSSLPKPQNKLPGSAPRERGLNFVITIKDFEKLLQAHPSAAGLPGRSLWDAFLRKLWDINSLDELHTFFDRRSHLLARTKEEEIRDEAMGIPPLEKKMFLLARTSPIGAFVRRAQLEFARLKFHDALDLWKSFTRFRQSSLEAWRKRNPGAGPWSFDAVLNGAVDEWDESARNTFMDVGYDGSFDKHNGEGLVSTNDVQKLLEFQVEQMQKLGERVPEAIQDQFKGILESNVMIPSLSHYVRFLDAWRAGDYPTSFDNLHRFFDYTMQNRDRLFYQYALLNLAVLQADFGCHQEAVAAMLETVATARENKDMGCLNFSLSWLNQERKTHASVLSATDKTNMLGTEREGLAFLRLKAKESEMWSLWSSSLLSEAKMTLSKGESVASAFENILRSSELSVTKNMMDNVGAQMMLQSSLWSRLGITKLAWTYCEIFLRSHSRYAPFDDILRFSCRSAYLLSQKGRYTEAREKLNALDANSLRSLKASQYWALFQGILTLQELLHKDKLMEADLILPRLVQSRGGDPEISFELNLLHIDALMRRGDYSAALSLIEYIAADFRGQGEDVFFHVKLLCLKTHVFIRCGRPQKGFSIAVRAATMAWRARLLSSLWESLGLVACILSSVEEFVAAGGILKAVLPRALECEDLALVAMLWSLKVDADMGQAGQAESGSAKRREKFIVALEGLERCFEAYAKLGENKKMRECLAKRAVVLRQLGEKELVADAIAAYERLRLGESIAAYRSTGDMRNQ